MGWSRTIYDAHGQAIGMACGRGNSPSCACGARASRKCDYLLRGGKQGWTCDRDLCGSCAVRVGPDRDYCVAHAQLDKKGG